MASKSALQSMLYLQKPFRRRLAIDCVVGSSAHPSGPHRCLFSSRPEGVDRVIDRADRPRWAHTPPAMEAPVRMRKREADNAWKVNDSPQVLNKMYNRLLGPGGENMLTEEVKWLAVTHKSFDHGRRGYNDRLGFLGRRIVTLQTTLALINSSATSRQPEAERLYSVFKESPFQHPAIDAASTLTNDSVIDMIGKHRIAPLASRCGLAAVVRWLPKKVRNLTASGQEAVITEALFAIVGAIALQRGGEEAAKVARERILMPLGIGS